MKTITRIPPQNLEAEAAILASILIDVNNRALSEIIDILKPDDFYKEQHRIIYKAMISLAVKKEPVDIVTVKNYLKDSGGLEPVGGAAYLAQLTDEAPIAINIKHYCMVIKNKKAARDLIAECSNAINSAYSTVAFSETLDTIQTNILNIGSDKPLSFRTMPDMIESSLNRYEKMNKGGVYGIKTGFHEIDALTGGFQGAKFILICARPRIGKTAMMLSMARNMASRNRKVGIFSIEMPEDDIVNRLYSMNTGINSIRLSSGSGPNKDEWAKILNASEKMSKWNILLDETGGLSVSELKRRCRVMKKNGVEIIFIDQLSKISGGEGGKEYEKKTSIVNQLSEFKKEVGIPIVLLAQINRNVENRNVKRPSLGDLKSTGSLEEDADIIFLGHREYEYTKEESQINDAEWEIAKHRGGPERIVYLHWEPKTTTFHNIERNE